MNPTNNNVTLLAGVTSLLMGTGVMNGVWYPNKDGSGNILDASWASLPLDSWARVNDTKLQQVRDILLAGGYDVTSSVNSFGSGKTIAVSFNAWVSPAIDLAGGRLWNMYGGGHSDASFNGIIDLNLEKMGGGVGWGVESMPTLFSTDPRVPVDYQTYKTNAFANYMAWQPQATSPAEEAAYSWTDFVPDRDTGLFYRPTSRHQYGGCYYDSNRNHLVSTRTSLIRYSLDTHSYVGRQRYSIAGTENPLDLAGYGYGMYHHENDTFVGNLPRSRTSASPANDLGYLSGTSAVRNSLDSTVGSPVVADQNQAWTRIDNDNVLALGNSGAGLVYGYLNVKTRTRPQAAAPVTNGLASSGDHPAACFVPAQTGGRWNKVIRRLNDNTGTWRIIDVPTMTESAYTPAGSVPPFAKQPGGWMFYYPRRKCVIYISSVNDFSDAIYVMRVG